MTVAFDSVLYTLLCLYSLVGGVSVYQYSKLSVCGGEASSLLPLTVQQQVHFIIVIYCFVRSAFFYVASMSWDSEEGLVYDHKVLFYSLDEISALLFFTLTCLLALFWAELFYIARNEEVEFKKIIRPSFYLINVLAYIGVLTCSFIVRSTSDNDVYYVFFQYTLLESICYFMAIALFSYFSSIAAAELMLVPIHLSTRKRRLRSLRLLGVVVVVSLVIKSLVLIAITGRRLVTESAKQLILMFLYYFCLELCPIASVLLFYKVQATLSGKEGMMDDESDEDDYATNEEVAPIVRGGAKSVTSVIASLSMKS